MIGGPTGLFGATHDRARRAALLVLAALALMLVPATALAQDPTTDQYASHLEQVCIDGNLVTVNADGGDGGNASGAAGSGSDSCAEGGGNLASSGGGGTGSGGGSSALGPLPFTGLDLAVLAALAAALLAAGLLLRRHRVAEAAE